jgi:hypothetical protein
VTSARTKETSVVAAPARPKGTPVAGRVVDREGLQPLEGRVVAIGPFRAVTDADGGFTIDDVPETYDLAIAEPQGETATVYRSLHRRDPLLRHETIYPEAGAHAADIVGSLAGGGPLKPGEVAGVAFVASSGAVFEQGPFSYPCERATYPECRELRLVWLGPDTVTGEVVALRIPSAAARARGAPVLLGHQKVTLRGHPAVQATRELDEQNCAHPPAVVDPPPDPPLRVALQLAPAPQRHVAVEVDGKDVGMLSIQYQWPARRGIVGMDWPRASDERPPPGPLKLEADVPDLSGLGATFCLKGATQSPSQAETCSDPRGGPVRLQRLIPRAVSLPRGAPKWLDRPLLTRETQFSWTRADGVAFYHLELQPPLPPSGFPVIEVYTEGTSAGWPDLGAAGVPFPADFVSYRVSVVGFGSFASLDEAVSPTGLGAAPLASPGIFAWPGNTVWAVIVTPIGGAPPAGPTCKLPGLDCGSPPDCGCATRACFCGLCELINHPPWDIWDADWTLTLHPGLAAALGQRCIQTCDGLRAFREAYLRYDKTHHGFAAFDSQMKSRPPRGP